MKTLAAILLLTLSLFAIDWSERSTQELLAAIQEAKGADAAVILHELKKRLPAMTKVEKKAYEKARKRIEQDGR